MNSSHLFARVAESIVIFAHMSQVGCFSACCAFAFAIFSFGQSFLSLKGHHDAVSHIFFTSLFFQDLSACQTAECSESIGLTSHQYFFNNKFISSHQETIVSLFASAIIFHFVNAAFVGSIHIAHTSEVTNMSVPMSVEMSNNHFIQVRIFNFQLSIFNFQFLILYLSSVAFSSLKITTFFGLNSWICFEMSSMFEFADIA